MAREVVLVGDVQDPDRITCLEYFVHTGHGELDAAFEFLAQVALDAGREFAVLEEHQEPAIGARDGKQLVQGLLEQILKIHFFSQELGRFENGLEVEFRTGPIQAQQGEGVGAVRQPEGCAWLPGHAAKLLVLVETAMGGLEILGPPDVIPKVQTEWLRLIMLSESTTSQRLCRPRVTDRVSGTVRSNPWRSRIRSW